MGGFNTFPTCPPPDKTQGKVVHRPWFSPEEYKQLNEAARAYAYKPSNGRFKWNAEQVYDFILFMANTGLRPDEAFNLHTGDVAIVTDDASDNQILEIEVRGKRGVGHCKSTPALCALISVYLPARNPFKAKRTDNGNSGARKGESHHRRQRSNIRT